MLSFKCNCCEQYTSWAGAEQQQKPFKNHAKRFKKTTRYASIFVEHFIYKFYSSIYYALKSLHTKTKCSCNQSIMIAAHVFFFIPPTVFYRRCQRNRSNHVNVEPNVFHQNTNEKKIIRILKIKYEHFDRI